MKQTSSNGKKISRRGILPIIGSTLLIPFLSFGKSTKTDNLVPNQSEEYQTLLKPDGTAVKVKVSTVKNSKVLKKQVSNTSFLSWLGRKL